MKHETASVISRLRTQASEAASETAFALLDGLWHGPVGLAVLDRGLRFIQVNDPFAELNDVSTVAHAGRTFPEVAAGHAPAVREEMERLESACRAVVDTGRPFLNLVARGTHADGRAREWLCSVFPIAAMDGSVRGVLAMLSDATDDREREAALARARDDAEKIALERTRLLEAEREARAAEARSGALLDALVENAPIGIAFFDREMRFRRLNQVLADIDGVPVTEHLGRTLRELLPGLHPEGIDDAWSEILRTGTPLLEAEIEGETPAAPGKRRSLTASWYPVRSHDEVLGIGALVRDVTEEREAEEFQRNVLGIVGHDLRNPLAALVNCAHLLSKAEDLRPDRRRMAARLLANASRMERIVSVLLDYARVRSGSRLPLHRRRCDVAKIAEAVADESEAAHPGREVRCRGEGDATGRWDPDRIAQVLANLVSNALDYSAPGTPVDVSWRDTGGAVVVEIANHGAPIPPDVLPRLFEPFRRAERQRAGGKDGLGLGLFIVRAIVTAHGGSIEARSAEGEQTVFTVRLPRRPEPG